MVYDNRKSNGSVLVNDQEQSTPNGAQVASRVLEGIYEQVQWQLLIEGKAIKRLVSFQLNQGFNQHHTFTLRVYHSELEEPRAYRIDQTKDLLGKALTVTMGSPLQDDRVQFTGLITGVSFQESQGLNGEVVLTGYSPTILLEAGSHLHSFYNKNLQTIAREVTEALAGKLEVSLEPRYSEQLPYVAQHQESGFRFLNRLASWYGEWFYYDGRKLRLGKPGDLPKHKLYYVRHIEGLQMDMQVAPMTFSHLSYQSSDDKVLSQQSPQRVDGLNFYGDLAVEKSDALFGQRAKNRPTQVTGNQGALEHVARVNKGITAGNIFTIRGTSKVPYLMPGVKITIMLGETELGEYLVTEVVHQLGNGNQYSGSFTAVAGDINIIPAPVLEAPAAEPQLAVVRKNDDPEGQGRVRVQFQWQEGDNLSDWIRVMTPDAGAANKVATNRGFVFVPEVGDQVMVGFEGGNASYPFVLGSLYHGKNGKGGGDDNHLKSIVTRSGHRIELDDSRDNMGITISDRNGNTIHIDTINNSIHISSLEQISLTAKSIDLSASHSITLSAGENVSIAAGENISQYAGNNCSVSAKHVTTVADENAIFQAKNIEKTAEEVKIDSTKENLQLQSSKSVNVKSTEKVKLF